MWRIEAVLALRHDALKVSVADCFIEACSVAVDEIGVQHGRAGGHHRT
jgi:hypothetical protein